MKRIFPLLFVTLSLTSNAQQSVLRGIVSIHNSETNTGKRQYVANAQVEDDFNKAQTTVTDINGQFSLIFIGLPEKSVVSFQVKKRSLQVVNIADLRATTGQTDLIRISMALPDSINEYRKKIYRVGKTQAEKRLDYLIAQKSSALNRIKRDNSENAVRIKYLEQELVDLDNQRKKIEEQAKELARKYAPVNLDDASPFFKTAFHLFQLGNLDSALLVLIKVDLANKVYQVLAEREKLEKLQSEISQRDSIQRERTEDIAKALRFKADLHKTLFQFDSTANCFDLLFKLDSTNTNYLFDYAHFLAWQNRYDEAIFFYNKVLSKKMLLAQANRRAYENEISAIQNNLGSLYRNKNNLIKAESALNEALEISKRLAKTDPQTYEADVATTQNNLGILYHTSNNFTKAEAAYKEALDIYVRMSKSNPQTYEPDIARMYNNLGVLYKDGNNFAKAEAAYSKALEIRKRLAKINPQAYEADVATTQNNLGAFFHTKNEPARAIAALKEALDIYTRLATTNPLTYEPDVATMQGNLGILYGKANDLTRAEAAYSKALEIRKRLAQTNPQTYEPTVAITLNNLGTLYTNKPDFTKAEATLREALDIYNRLAQANPQAYEPDYAMIQNNIGVLYIEMKDTSKAESAYIIALEIRERLAHADPQTYEPDLAATQNNLAALYSAKKNFVKAEAALNAVLVIRKHLAQSNPQTYLPDVASTSNNLGSMYFAKSEFTKSEISLRETLDIYKHLAQTSPQAFEPYVARAQKNLGILYREIKKIDSAELQFIAAIQIFEKWRKSDQGLFAADWENSVANIIYLYEIVRDTISINESKISWQKKIIEMYDKLCQVNKTDNNIVTSLAQGYGALSWYQVLARKFDEAEQSALRGLHTDSTQAWIKINLAHALLLRGKYDNAINICKQLKSLKDQNGKSYVDIFIEDLDAIEKEGITHTDIIRIREYLKK